MGLFEFINNKEIETRTPQNLPPLKLQKMEISRYIAQHTSEHLKDAHKFFFGKTTASPKAALINMIADFLNFSKVEQFREWFFTLPELTQKLLREAAFTDYLLIPHLEKKWGVSLTEKEKHYWKTEWRFKPELKLGFLHLHDHYDCPVTGIPGYLRIVLNMWLAPPVSSLLSSCRITDQTDSWNISYLIPDTLPLLCDALNSVLETMDNDNPEKLARSGFKKKEINELRVSTGFLPFKMEGEYAPSGIDIAARFVLCMCNFKPQRPKDGQDGIRHLLLAFFRDTTQYPKSWYFPDRGFLEHNICLDHLSRTPGYYMENNDALPASRAIFFNILTYVAQDGGWFDADKLAEYIKINGLNFSFCDPFLEHRLKVKAETFVLDNITLTSNYEEFHPHGIMRFYLLVRPLFKAYCYIFAALGLLEITQDRPPLVRNYRNKQYPCSIYDSLKAIRITELGRWCLGLTDKRPPKPSQEYQAIADRELLLVTVQGNSLERQVYLDKIGQRLGENRWRISPASFTRGCLNKRQIVERIDRFKSLIDPNPAPHWEQLFKKVVDRAGLFDKKRTDMLVYDLPEDREIQEDLLRDPEIKRFVRRVEGRLLVVAAKDESKFYALLGEHGITHF